MFFGVGEAEVLEDVEAEILFAGGGFGVELEVGFWFEVLGEGEGEG